MALKGVPQSVAHVAKRSGENAYQWKGENVGYRNLHKWVQKKLGKASKCENINCHYPRKNARGRLLLEPSKFHWANKSHEYNRVLEDWVQLCVRCHSLFDHGQEKSRYKEPLPIRFK